MHNANVAAEKIIVVIELFALTNTTPPLSAAICASTPRPFWERLRRKASYAELCIGILTKYLHEFGPTLRVILLPIVQHIKKYFQAVMACPGVTYQASPKDGTVPFGMRSATATMTYFCNLALSTSPGPSFDGRIAHMPS